MSHIVLIEPDRQLAETYCKSLRSAGHSVTPCASAQAGIMAADQIRPDIVVLELQLIEHSGIEFLYEFRSYSDWRNIPVIVHSHVPAQEFGASEKLLSKHLGIGEYLYKPHTTLNQLLRSVNEQLPVLA